MKNILKCLIEVSSYKSNTYLMNIPNNLQNCIIYNSFVHLTLTENNLA